MSHFRRRATLRMPLATSLAIFSICTPTWLAAQHTAGLVPVDSALLEVRIGDVATGLARAYRRADSTIVVLHDVLTIAGVDARARDSVPVPPAGLADRLHADVHVDWSALALFVADSGTLPVSRRAARSRARAALLARPDPPTLAPLARAPRMPAALALDYAVARDAGLALDVGTRAIAGDIDVAIAGLGTRSVNGIRAAWESIPPGDAVARRWRVGTLDDLAGRAGIRLTNMPLTLADSIGAIPLHAVAPSGSDVDVYVDGSLVATDSARTDGSVHLRALEQFGAHDVRVVTYAADGRDRVLLRRRIVTPDALLPARAVRYRVAVAPCVSSRCGAIAGRITFAPIDGITIGAGLQPRSRGGTTGTFSLDARVADAIVLAAREEPATGSRVELYRDRGGGTGIALRSISAPMRPRMTSLSGAWRLAGDAFARVEGVRDGRGWRGIASATLSTPVGTVMPAAMVAAPSHDTRRIRFGLDALLVGGWLPEAAGPLRRALVRLHEGSTAPVATQRMVTLVFPASTHLSVEASVVWSDDASRRRRIASVTVRRRLAAATVRVTAERGGILPVDREEMTGSVVIDAARRRLRAGADPLVGRAGVHGRVFVDRDGDGRYGPIDEALAGVAVRIGGTAALTDADGGFEAWDLTPYRRVLVEVDSLSIDTEQLDSPAATSVQPVPHALTWVDIPIRLRARRGGAP